MVSLYNHSMILTEVFLKPKYGEKQCHTKNMRFWIKILSILALL